MLICFSLLLTLLTEFTFVYIFVLNEINEINIYALTSRSGVIMKYSVNVLPPPSQPTLSQTKTLQVCVCVSRAMVTEKAGWKRWPIAAYNEILITLFVMLENYNRVYLEHRWQIDAVMRGRSGSLIYVTHFQSSNHPHVFLSLYI